MARPAPPRCGVGPCASRIGRPVRGRARVGRRTARGASKPPTHATGRGDAEKPDLRHPGAYEGPSVPRCPSGAGLPIMPETIRLHAGHSGGAAAVPAGDRRPRAGTDPLRPRPPFVADPGDAASHGRGGAGRGRSLRAGGEVAVRPGSAGSDLVDAWSGPGRWGRFSLKSVGIGVLPGRAGLVLRPSAGGAPRAGGGTDRRPAPGDPATDGGKGGGLTSRHERPARSAGCVERVRHVTH